MISFWISVVPQKIGWRQLPQLRPGQPPRRRHRQT